MHNIILLQKFCGHNIILLQKFCGLHVAKMYQFFFCHLALFDFSSWIKILEWLFCVKLTRVKFSCHHDILWLWFKQRVSKYCKYLNFLCGKLIVLFLFGVSTETYQAHRNRSQDQFRVCRLCWLPDALFQLGSMEQSHWATKIWRLW